MDNINKKLSELMSSGFTVNQADVLENILLRIISGNLMASVAVQKIIAIERQITTGKIDDADIGKEMSSIADQVADAANKNYQSLLADLHLRWTNNQTDINNP